MVRVSSRKKVMSKNDDPDNPLVFRDWKKDLDAVINSMPRGQECTSATCTSLSMNRNAFLCKNCGIKYYDAYKGIVSTTERARAQYNWLRQFVLVQDPE